MISELGIKEVDLRLQPQLREMALRRLEGVAVGPSIAARELVTCERSCDEEEMGGQWCWAI